MSSNLKLKPIPTTPIVDVFQGDGWDTWTRLLWKNRKLIPLKGAMLTEEQLAQVQKELTRK